MPSKRKNKPSRGKKKVVARSAESAQPFSESPANPPKPGLAISPSGWTLVLLTIAVLLWFYCSASHYPQAEKVFLAIAILIGASYFLNLSNLRYTLFLVGLGWVLVVFALGTNPNFSQFFSFWPGHQIPNPLMTFALGSGLLIAFWRFFPPVDPSQDISKGWARVWFWIIMAVAFYFRMYKAHEAAGIYWDDCVVSAIDARSILEFHERPFLMPIANREPFYCYFLAALWSFMPNAYAVFVHRLGGAIIDLAAVWFFYLVGKEVGGRRVGLVAAALGAVSKPMIIASVTGNAHVTGPMAVALVLFTTVRLFKNPDWKQFVFWGLALGFAPYNYTSVRPWLLFIVTAVFLWIWFGQRKEGRGKWDILLGWGTLLAWAFCFLLVNNFLPKQSFWVSFLSRGWVGIAVIAVLLFFFFKSLSEPRSSLVPRFFAGVSLAALAVYPIAIQPLIAVHASGLSIFHSHDSSLAVHFGLDSFKLLVEKLADTLRTVFIGGEDRGDMNLAGDAFFDYHMIPILVLGLVSFLVRPNWMTGFFLIAGLVGISPHVLSIDPHSGKLICCVAPLAVLGGMGVQQVYSAFKTATSGSLTRFLAVPVLAAYFAWAIWGTSGKTIDTFFVGCRVEKTVSLQIKKFSPRAKVFIAPYPLFVSSVVQAVLDQGYDVYLQKDKNPIYLNPGENPKDAVVLMYIGDDLNRTKIEKQYKNVQWDVINLDGWKDIRPTFRRAIIPASEITDKADQMFYFQRVPADYWTRDYLVGRYILGYGVIEMEERLSNPFDPIAFGMGGRLVNLKGNIYIPTTDQVVFKVKTNDFVKLRVDGRQIIYLNPFWPPVAASGKMNLTAGVHRVEYDIWLQHDQFIPPVMVSIGGALDVPLSFLGQNPAISAVH